ncbi:PD-(D/E)XK nuclease family protein [Pseudomonas mosselii]|uniref:PD-(D/E)XK nuclease family protein n=1 Tax=Pseudomonas mosselii TaxID=78327 RepID=UPI0021D8200F|nr:PD-(D/E)XK nuclease family protein [Pseudomonas mosselii]MCU9528092.1 PD-(D/E)XK nuclease family protein [Pseudomonas mosselii]MCU9535200.1 PD-(D/E)XK nuclease family protein [Pseudomonas mosselii]MCU9542978.1 PD-(D/E)XK nuclease family protein [Pseudomonas mosselii]MCU9546936.1 PD-(D/E)XK nuclease family protein [Pseudomonas mosselii]
MKFMSHLADLSDGTFVLASTERVARHIKLHAALLQAVGGKKAWFAKGQIMTITKWIENTWLELMPDEQLLYPVQELATVKAIIDQSGLLPANMISSTNAARRVGVAYSDAYKYRIDMDIDRYRFKEEFEAFYQWKQQLDAHCTSKQYVFRAHLPGLLLDAMRSGLVDAPERIVIVGMIDLNPAEKAVFEALELAGTEVTVVSPEGDKSTPRLVRSHNNASEMLEVAQWVAKQLQPFVDTPQAAPSLAIVVPDIRSYKGPLLDALSLHTSPGALMPAGPDGEARAPWDISSGATLGSRPMIRAAMDLLSITPEKADPETFSRVLRSKWIGGHVGESATRALLDIWFRDNMGLNMGGKDFLRAIGSYKGEAVPDFRKRFGGLLEKLISGEQTRYPSEWADHFSEALNDIGWPGQSELDSANFQTLNAWAEALTLFRTLDAQLGTVQYERAFMWLREIVDTRQFQPRISHLAPVSILGYEDAIGLSFDALWVIGASNNVLPGRAEPSPFIPTDLQVKAGIAEASCEGMLVYAQSVAGALLSTSTDVTVSCPSHNEKGASVGASELFGSWPAEAPTLETKGDFLDDLMGTLDRTVFDIETIPPVTPLELTDIKGGVRIFKDYAESPFFSFVRNRLRAEMFPQPIIGLDPRIQGTMVHLVLELFWKATRTSKALKEFSDEALKAVVETYTQQASEQLLYKLIWRYGMKLIRLEQRRIVDLAIEWLELEKQRAYEFEVIGFEERHDILVGDVPLTVSLDRRVRIFLDDEQTQTRVVVEDYKTGQEMRMNSLNASSLTEPQLPIYATKLDQADGANAIDGIVLAQVNQKSLGYHARSNFSASLVSGKRPRPEDVDTSDKWEEQKDAWNRSLDAMSAGFVAGNGNLDLDGKAYPIGYEYIAPLAR